jgi:Mg-chelatase subunit ChlD
MKKPPVLRRSLALPTALALLALAAGPARATVTPSVSALTVAAGSSVTTTATIDVPANPVTTPPTDVDIEIAIDTTGSMGPGIAQAKADATALVTSMQAAIPGAQFSIVQFRDQFDTPVYQVEQPLTADPALIDLALGRLTAGGGGDAPEAINLVYHNSAVPAVGGPIGWRDGVQKFLIVLSDASPHGAGTSGIPNCTDPTIDPLGYTTRTAINEMIGAGRSLFMVLEPGFVSTTLSCYQFLALAVGGNSRGLPGGTNLAT